MAGGGLPSALERLDEIEGRLRGRRLALFLDYDGTLSPIVSRPERALLAPGTRALLRRLARRVPVAIVSGRALQDLRPLVDVEELAYAGNHGLEIRGPEGRLAHDAGRDFAGALAGARAQLAPVVERVPGAWLEDKGATLSVHYRQAPDDREGELAAAVARELAPFPRLRLHRGKKVLEVRPAVDWHKGEAVLWLLAALDLDGPEVVPVYIGDDATDEDAFRAIAGRGVGILVSEAAQPSAAEYGLRDPEQVRGFLERLEARLPGSGG